MLDYRRQPSQVNYLSSLCLNLVLYLTQNVEAILARSEQVMGICQGILNGEMITPTYQPISPATSLPCLAEPAVEEVQGAEGNVSSTTAEEATLGGLDRLRGRPSPSVLPGGVVAPVQPVTNPPYMNSAALNEIAGELLITVRELREELLQVIRRMSDLTYTPCHFRSGRHANDWSVKSFSNVNCFLSCAGRC